ncbi:hypothetical protein ACOSQ3_002162 [Xanthoceras sorbifolium]
MLRLQLIVDTCLVYCTDNRVDRIRISLIVYCSTPNVGFELETVMADGRDASCPLFFLPNHVGGLQVPTIALTWNHLDIGKRLFLYQSSTKKINKFINLPL